MAAVSAHEAAPSDSYLGKNDFIFTLNGAVAFSKELYNVEPHLLCGGHFLLEEQVCQVSQLIKSFFYSRLIVQ
ncbi:hypothetical protein [Bacillus sp. ok061]|uniref:hypothetical protein n=1 Tax=Bacillus sp. ok061 TaxID=1761766 RepID=UPI00215629DA|nr:hypothetical protein [Bacillus sp. ok061]